MSQLNIHMTPAFERVLKRFMQIRKIRTKSEAIRLAVQESLEREIRDASSTDFTSWLGLGRTARENPTPRFPSHEALWE